MYKKCKMIFGIAILTAAIVGYARENIDSFVAVNFDNKPATHATDNQKKGILSTIFDKVSPIVDKFITPKKVLEYRKNKQVRSALTDREATKIICSFENTLSDDNALESNEIKQL